MTKLITIICCLTVLGLQQSFAQQPSASTEIKLPTKLSDFDNLDIGVLDVTNSVDVKGSFESIFSTEYSKNSVRIVQNFIRYKDIKIGDSTVRFFVGYRLYISITDIKISGNLTLTQLSAAVTIGKAKASYKFSEFGFTNIDYTKLPPTNNFDANSYSQIRAYFDSLIQALTDATNISAIVATANNYSKYSLNNVLDANSLKADQSSATVSEVKAKALLHIK